MRALKAAGPRVVIFTSGEGSSQRQANSGTLTAAWQLAVMQDKNPLTRRVRSRELVMASMEAAMAKAVDEARAQEGGESVVCVTGSFTAVSAAMRTTTYQHHFRHSLFS